VLVQWLVAAFMSDKPPGKFYEALFVGSFWGTLFGHTTLAAAWTAFGPAPFVVRLPLTLLWVATLPIAIAINLHMNAGLAGMAIPIGSTLFAQWLILQFPLWDLALGMGLRLLHSDDIDQRPGMDPPQFTIRQLFTVTAIVGVLFGLGRLLLPVVVQVGREASVFWLLAAAELLLTFPLVLVVLVRRLTIRGMVLMFVLVGTASFWQIPFFGVGQTLFWALAFDDLHQCGNLAGNAIAPNRHSAQRIQLGCDSVLGGGLVQRAQVGQRFLAEARPRRRRTMR
jgi:hypothetical protein